MAKTMKRPSPAKPAASPRPGAFKADPRRETIFEMYRDLGPGRSFRKLQEAVAVRWPANPISLGALNGWSTQFGWRKRIEEFELGQQRATPTQPPQQVSVSSDDDVENLQRAASSALARVLQGMQVAITRPGDVKALVDTASKALELADKLKQERTGTATSEEIATFGAKLLDRIIEARRKDVVTMLKAVVEAACAEAGTTAILAVMKKGAAAIGLRVNDEGEIDGSATPLLGDSSVVDGGLGPVVDGDVDASDEEVETKTTEANSAQVGDGLDLDEVMNRLRGE